MKQDDKPLKRKDLNLYPLKLSVSKSDTSESSEISGNSGKHKLATIMFSDICGFTKMMGKDEVKTMQFVERNMQIHRKYIHIHNGILIKEMGDGLMASFESTHDAVRCAKEIMDEVISTREYNLHIGIHLGDIIFKEDDIYGDGVNIAARINSCAREGEIIVSEEVWKNIRNQTEFTNEYLGKRMLKNVDQPVKLHRVLLDDEKRKIQIKAILYTHSKEIRVAVASVLIISVFLTIYYFLRTPYPMTGDDLNTIAVLPFESKIGNSDYDYLKEGLAEDVISELFHLNALSVISSRSTFRFKDSEVPIQQISRELKADVVLVGNYTIQGDQIEVKVEVIKGRDNEIMNYASITGNLAEIKNISSQIGENIYKTLNISHGKNSINFSTDHQSINVDAYKYYVLGKSAMHDHTLQKIEDITRYFQAAIDIDSTYADPYLGMAEAYIFDVNRGYLSPVEGAQKARKYALKAERLKSGSGEVSGIIGIIHALDFEFKKAIPYFEKSIELSPNYDLSYQWYAFTLEAMDEFEKAAAIQRKVGVLDPLNAFNDIYLALNYLIQKRFSDAQQILDTKLMLVPDHIETLWMQAILYTQQKKYSEAYEALLNRGVGLETNFVAGYTYAMIGDEEKAKKVLNNMIDASDRGFVPPTQIAIVYCGLKDYDKALDQIEKAFLIHDIWLGWLKYLDFAGPLNNDPRFIDLMKQFEFN